MVKTIDELRQLLDLATERGLKELAWGDLRVVFGDLVPLPTFDPTDTSVPDRPLTSAQRDFMVRNGLLDLVDGSPAEVD